MNTPAMEGPDPVRPARLQEEPVPPLPVIEESQAGEASTIYSHYRSGLSRHRTGLSGHRTSLSEYRTDLSGQRTSMSKRRTEMSMRRTGMSFQRTRMSADRTMMSVIRTALSLISFGFTIFQVFGKLRDAGIIQNVHAARNFGTTLVFIGIAVLLMGIIHHVQFMRGLRRTRAEMREGSLIHAESVFPVSFSLLTALALLALGLFAAVSMMLHVGPLR